MSFDLDAVANDGTPFEFTFGGETYTLPADIPMEVPPLFSNGQDIEAFEVLLGTEQWERVKASDKVLGQKQARALIRAYNEHLGFTTPGGS